MSVLRVPSFSDTNKSQSKGMFRYETILSWSEEDQAYIAEVPELPGCMAHGDSYESALANAQEAIQLWLDTAHEFGDPIPVAKGRRLLSA